MRNIAIASPSGHFYGSEQVLFDFLGTTTHKYVVYMPNGLFFEKVNQQSAHTARLFSSVKKLYLHLAWLLLREKYDGVYINEGGHIKYVNILADLFPQKHFYVHIRLLEDSLAKRLGKKRSNISYISVSEYITHEVKYNTGIECYTMYDIYKPISGIDGIKNIQLYDNVLRLGIVGRVTTTKGLKDIVRFCDYCENHPAKYTFEFHFYGGIDSYITEVQKFVIKAETYSKIKCLFHGFVNDKKQIYETIDLLVHFNRVEPLGRIIMEALDFGVPFIGFEAGGVGELAEQFGVSENMISYEDNWESAFQKKLVDIVVNADKMKESYKEAKIRMKSVCSPLTYTQNLEHLFYE